MNLHICSSYRKFRWANAICYCGFRLLFQGRLTQWLYANVSDESVPYATPMVFIFMNILNFMISVFSYRLIKTDFCGGWKRTSGEYSYDVSTNKAKTFIDWTDFHLRRFSLILVPHIRFSLCLIKSLQKFLG